MRTVLALLTVGLATLAAGEPAKKPAKKAAEKPAPVSQMGNEKIIPAGAAQVDAHTWLATDTAGRKWYYRKTPFGVMKTDVDVTADSATASRVETRKNPFSGDKAGPPSDAAERSLKSNVKVVDLGDSYSFERPTPFGVSKWTHKKADLTEEDRALIEAGKPQPPVEARN